MGQRLWLQLRFNNDRSDFASSGLRLSLDLPNVMRTVKNPARSGGVLYWNTLRLFWIEHDADGRGSFAAVERSISNRLLGFAILAILPSNRPHASVTSALEGMDASRSLPPA